LAARYSACCKARTGSTGADPTAAELAETALTGHLQVRHHASTKQRPFPHRRLCCPLGSSSTTAASDAHPARHPFPGLPVIGHAAPATHPQVTGPGRASPVPAATVDTFRAPYAGESFGACTSRSSAPSMAFALMEGARHSLIPARKRATLTTPQASLHATDRIVAPPFTGLLTLGFDPARFQTEPPACYRAS